MNTNNLKRIFSDDPEVLKVLEQRELKKVLSVIQKEKGESGTSGFSGYSGEQGVSGFSGAKGLDGKGGRNGLDGADGANGVSGTSGFSGYSGKEAELPDLEEFTKDVIKELKKKQYLEPKDIKGMPINMNDQRWHGAGGSGGGSGISGTSGTSGFSGYSGATGGGTSSLNIITVASDYEMTNFDDVVWVDASSNPVIVTLPVTATAIKKVFTVRKIDGSFLVTVTSDSTINGETDQSIRYKWNSAGFISDNFVWSIN